MKFRSDEQRRAVMAKLNPGKGLPRKPRLPLKSPYRVKGRTVPIGKPQDWLRQAAMLLRGAEDSEQRGHSPEGIFRQARRRLQCPHRRPNPLHRRRLPEAAPWSHLATMATTAMRIPSLPGDVGHLNADCLRDVPQHISSSRGHVVWGVVEESVVGSAPQRGRGRGSECQSGYHMGVVFMPVPRIPDGRGL